MNARLEDMEGVRQRKAKYCRYLDTKQFDAWEALFTPGAKPRDGNPPRTMHGYGFYHERWKLIDGQWRLAHLELHRSILDFA